MDGNKDEGLRCMRMGESAMKSGEKARALKFLNMAKRIYPNPQVDAFLRELAEGEEPAAAKNSGSERESKFPAGAGNGVHDGKGRANSVPRSRSVNAEGEANGNEEGRRSGIPRSRSTTSVSDATPEQIEIVRRIRRTKDYYEILGLTKTCSEGEVRKAYRKLSLKVHPDKNSAPGAEEAFKSVSKAFQVLSDADLRDKFDRDGPDEDIQHVRHRHSARQYGGAPVYYEDVFDANDIFNSFFFGMQQPNGNFRRAQFVRTQAPHFTQAQRGEAHSINLLSLLQLLPILILLIVSLFPFSQPVFNLMSVAPYQIQRKTAEHEVHYYVKSHNFDKEYPPGSAARRKVEGQVESEYRDILVQNCRMELGMRRWGQSSETPNCDRLKRFDRS